jgi:hypothetical protein
MEFLDDTYEGPEQPVDYRPHVCEAQVPEEDMDLFSPARMI